MAARKKQLHPLRVEEMREKIKATLLINKLEDHVLNGTELSSTQVSAALGLLKKRIPDLSATEFTGELAIKRSAAELTDDELAHIANAGSKRKS